MLERLGVAITDRTDRRLQRARSGDPARRNALHHLRKSDQSPAAAGDFERIAAIGQQHGIETIIDSTFGTPLNQQPLAFGIDYVMHSATKYLGGHHDLIAGVVIGKHDKIHELRAARTILGGVVAPETAFLLERGLRTLALRVDRHNANALGIARYLESHPKIDRVWYPGLESHPDHALACRQMTWLWGCGEL